jgi:hypothetical protein
MTTLIMGPPVVDFIISPNHPVLGEEGQGHLERTARLVAAEGSLDVAEVEATPPTLLCLSVSGSNRALRVTQLPPIEAVD